MLSLEYVAGLVDGEGHIRCASSNQGKYEKFYPRLQVTNTNYEIIETLQKQFGGSIMKKKMSAYAISRNWTQAYDWRISGDGARSTLSKLIPHLRIKRDIALEVLKADNKQVNF